MQRRFHHKDIFSLPLQDALRQFDCTRLVTVEQIKGGDWDNPGIGDDANARKTPPPGPRIKKIDEWVNTNNSECKPMSLPSSAIVLSQVNGFTIYHVHKTLHSLENVGGVIYDFTKYEYEVYATNGTSTVLLADAQSGNRAPLARTTAAGLVT